MVAERKDFVRTRLLYSGPPKAAPTTLEGLERPLVVTFLLPRPIPNTPANQSLLAPHQEKRSPSKEASFGLMVAKPAC